MFGAGTEFPHLPRQVLEARVVAEVRNVNCRLLLGVLDPQYD
jgi:hypothetical protein